MSLNQINQSTRKKGHRFWLNLVIFRSDRMPMVKWRIQSIKFNDKLKENVWVSTLNNGEMLDKPFSRTKKRSLDSYYMLTYCTAIGNQEAGTNFPRISNLQISAVRLKHLEDVTHSLGSAWIVANDWRRYRRNLTEQWQQKYINFPCPDSRYMFISRFSL